MRHFVITLVVIALLSPQSATAQEGQALVVATRSADLLCRDAMNKAVLRIREKVMSRADAVDIFAAFFQVKTRREALTQSLDKYLATGGDSFSILEVNLTVVDAARRLSDSLTALVPTANSHRLLDQEAMHAMAAYLRNSNGEVVHQFESERDLWLTVTVGEAVRLLGQLNDDNEAFLAAYKTLGAAILTNYGADAIKEAARKPTTQ
jgi:hypothetical protein